MIEDREGSSERLKKSYFCKVCQVACLNGDGLRSHYRDEEHEKMEDAYYGKKYGKHFYGSLQDYISCPMRKEPLIGLQYIIQLYPEIDCEDAFKCSLCKVIGPLYFIMKHIESFKHRRNYLSIAYKRLFPLYTKRQSYYERNWAVKKHALNVEQQEKTLTVNDSKSCTSRIGVKSDFFKYNIRRQEKLDEYAKKLSAYETQKKNILQYMETLVITSPEEAELVQSLTKELDAAVNVFNLNTKPKHEKYYRREQSTGDCERRYSRRTDFHRDKRSIWYEKNRKPSSSLCNDEVRSVSDKHSPTEQGRARKRSRSASKDMMLKVTFSTGSESGAKNENSREQQEQRSICPDKEQFVVLRGNLSETTEAIFHNSDANSDLIQEIQAKRIRKYSTDVAKWNSLFTSNRPEVGHSEFSWCPKSPSLNNTEVSPSEEKKQKPRRASLTALSSFTLFSQESHEQGPASCQQSSDTYKSFSPFRDPAFKSHKGNVFKDKDPQREPKIEWDRDQELPCSSNTVFNEDRSADNVLRHVKQEQYEEESTLNAEASCDQLSDVNANTAQALKSSHLLDASSKYSDFKSGGSRHLNTKIDSQDADSNTVGNTLTSSKLHASRRQLSPEVLQLFKGKDTNSIVNILKTLSPFYPALKELDLEAFAEVLSKTGAVAE